MTSTDTNQHPITARQADVLKKLALGSGTSTHDEAADLRLEFPRLVRRGLITNQGLITNEGCVRFLDLLEADTLVDNAETATDADRGAAWNARRIYVEKANYLLLAGHLTEDDARVTKAKGWAKAQCLPFHRPFQGVDAAGQPTFW